MDLDQAMLLLAQALNSQMENPGSDGLTESVRAGLLELLVNGRAPSSLGAVEQQSLLSWAAAQRDRGSDPVGEIYQQMLRRELVILTGNRLEIRAERREHRRSGAYYTAEDVVRYIVRRARELLPSATTLIDPACGAGAFLQAAREAFDGALSLVGWDLDPLAVALCRSRVPQAELHVRDALLTEEPGAYDLCLGNPPFISSGLRGAVVHDPERLRALRQRYPHAAEYKLNTYPLFVERGLELLRPGGILGFILPDSFLTGRYFAGLRRLLLQHSLLELSLIRQDFWSHGRVGQSVILFVRKGPAVPGEQVRVRICDTPGELENERVDEVSLEEVVWGPLRRFRLVPDPVTRQMLRQMEAQAQPLGHWLHSYSGLIGRRGQASLLVRPEDPQSCLGPTGRLLRSGREIDRYCLKWGGALVCLDPALIKSGGNHLYYQRPKLLLRQTADSLRAVLDDQGYYCLNNIHLLVPARGDANLRALLGLINSSPFGAFYRAVTMEAGRLYAQVDLDLLEGLPVPPLQPEHLSALEALVAARESAAPDEAALLERQIDEQVEALYGLVTGANGYGSE
ncbi:MAG: TaqI-like C-terminal specificity domain-containing protein [Bacillota bacterium]